MLIGLIASAPMGPVGVLCVQRTLNKGRWYGFITGIGAVVSDLIYAAITAYGMSYVMDVLNNQQTRMYLQIVGSVLLLVFGLYTYKSDPTKKIHNSGNGRGTLWHNGVTAFLVTFSNPLIIFLFLATFAQFAFNIYFTAYQAKRFDICEKYFEEAMKFEDENSHSFVVSSRPQMFLQKGDTVAWANELRSMIKADPHSSNAEVAAQNLLAYYSTKGVDKMTAFAQELLDADPNNKIANYGMGYVYVSQQKFAEAAKYYEKCVEIDPNYFDGNYQCGFCYYQIGLENGRKISDKKYASQAAADKEAETKVKSYLRKALPYFERARDLRPEEPERWASELKVIYNNLNMKDKAKSLPEI